METYNFQIPIDKPWDQTEPIKLELASREIAVGVAKALSKIYSKEVRMTTGNWQQASGAYILA